MPFGQRHCGNAEEDFTGAARQALVEQWINQQFFRRAVLGGYAGLDSHSAGVAVNETDGLLAAF
ncbi:hypothetical protein [Azotobacter beijerinckii]|uniref:hypothetical protein n=1 Tax=Azotobacter beijerinckii TaxID=170623 RepID=UPI000B864E87|nr:hypothetical protein [Azotobacter beijerinckii]